LAVLGFLAAVRPTVCALAAKPVPFEDPRSGSWGYQDPVDGRVVIPPSFSFALPFNAHGTAFAVFPKSPASNGGWFLIDGRGAPLLAPFIFDNVPDEFSEGLARFVKDGKMGFFDKSGKIVIPASYDFALPFENGAARVCRGCAQERYGEHYSMTGGQWGAVDRRGRFVVPLGPAPPSGTKD